MPPSNMSEYVLFVVLSALDCPYADRNTEVCPTIQKNQCYSYPNNVTCCETCDRLKTGSEGEVQDLVLSAHALGIYNEQ